jgi:hypothetical protein
MNTKRKRLIYGILCDLLGMVSIVFPPFDFVWAPLSAYIMTRLYGGREGRVAAVISFVEEALPFVDIVPSFTLMWVYTYYIRGRKTLEK